MTVWFTSDLHFGHPFVAGIRAGHVEPDREDWSLSAAHDRRVLDVINAHAGKADELYVLGDVSSGSRRSMDIAVENLAQLNVPVKRRHLILGNHETRSNGAIYSELYPLFGEIARQGRIYMDDGRQLILSHFQWRHLMDGSVIPEQATNATSLKLAKDAPVWTGNPHETLLHGHTHNRHVFDFDGRPGGYSQIHIGWDAWRRPVPLEELIPLFDRAEAERYSDKEHA